MMVASENIKESGGYDGTSKVDPIWAGCLGGLHGMAIPNSSVMKGMFKETMGDRAVVCGISMGVYNATFFGVKHFVAKKRGVDDVYTTMIASCAAASTIGLTCPGPPLARLKWATAGIILGVVTAYPVHYMHKYIGS